MPEINWMTHTLVDGMQNPLGRKLPATFLIGRFKRSGGFEHIKIHMPDSATMIAGREELHAWWGNEVQYFDQFINRELAFQDIIYKPVAGFKDINATVMMTINKFTGMIYFNSAVLARSHKWQLLIERDSPLPEQTKLF